MLTVEKQSAMRFLAFLCFLFTLPLVVFLSSVLYGGFTTTELKSELAKTDVYSNLATQVGSFTGSLDAADTPPAMSTLTSVLKEKLTADYLQQKTEGVVDDTASWVAGKTTNPPVLSFKDIKDEVEARNPEALTQLQQFADQLQQEAKAAEEQAQASGNSDQSQGNDAAFSANMLSSLLKNNFTIPLNTQLGGLKQSYQTLSLSFPILVVLLIISLAVLLFFNRTWSSRLRWIGVLFLLSAGFGYINLLMHETITIYVRHLMLQNTNTMVQAVSPFVDDVLTHFVNTYKSYQTNVNYAAAGLGVISLAGSFLIKTQNQASVSPKQSLKKKTK